MLKCVVLTFSFLALGARAGRNQEAEDQLLVDLFREYQPLARPVRNHTDGPIAVNMSLQLILLVDIDEVMQIMHTNVWITLNWYDEYLRWDSDFYGGLRTIRVPPDKVWNPDVVLMNNTNITIIPKCAPPRIYDCKIFMVEFISHRRLYFDTGKSEKDSADGEYQVSYQSNALISYTGLVQWVPPALYKSTCIMDVRYFPFDDQNCTMTFKSWTYNPNEVKLQLGGVSSGVDLSQYIPSYIWDVIDAPARNEDHTGRLMFEVHLRRKTLFYTVILIIPCVMMAILTAFVFYLPSAAGEKIGMSIYILLSLVVFLNLLMKILPSTSKTVPLLARYVLLIFILNVLSIIQSVMIVNLYFRGPHTHHLPTWVKFIFTKLLARFLYMQRPKRTPVMVSFDLTTSSIEKRKLSTYAALKEALQKMKEEDERNEPELHDRRARMSSVFTTDPVPHHPHCPQFGYPIPDGVPRIDLAPEADQAIMINLPEQQRPQTQHVPGLPESGYKVLQTIDFISEYLKRNEDLRKVRDDWKYVSMVVDRILLIIFLAIIIGTSVGLFMTAPNIYFPIDQRERIEYLSTKYGWVLARNYMKSIIKISDEQ